MFTVVLAVSTLFSAAFAADLPMYTPDTLVSVLIAKDADFNNDPETLRDTIANGVNFSTGGIIVRHSCGTPCQSGFLIDVKKNRLIPLPKAECEYSFAPGNELLIINPTPAEYTVGGVPMKECAHRRMYTLKHGRFVKFREDTASKADISNKDLFEMFLSTRFLTP